MLWRREKAHSGIKEVCVCTIYNLHAVIFQEDKCNSSGLWPASRSGCVGELIPQGSRTLLVSRRPACQIIINGTPAGITQKARLIWAELLPSASGCGNRDALLLCDWPPPCGWRSVFWDYFMQRWCHCFTAQQCSCAVVVAVVEEHVTPLLPRRKIKRHGIMREKNIFHTLINGAQARLRP